MMALKGNLVNQYKQSKLNNKDVFKDYKICDQIDKTNSFSRRQHSMDQSLCILYSSIIVYLFLLTLSDKSDILTTVICMFCVTK